MLPNEAFLQVLHFADYRTLVLAKLAGRRFLRLTTKFAEELAPRRSLLVAFSAACITYSDVTILAGGSIPYEPGNQASLAAACRELDGVIGPHAVTTLTFQENTWNIPGVGAVFENIPPLKYAEDVVLHSADGSTIVGNFEAFMSNFAGMKALCLYLDYHVFCQLRWAFLRRQSARELRLIKFIGSTPPTEDFARCVEELVCHCTTVPLELDFSAISFSAAFCRRIIELLKGSGRDATFRTALRSGELTLDESDYKVDVDDTTTRYTSAESGIVVEVNGRWIAVQSTAEVARKKPRTCEDVQSTARNT